MKLQKIGASLYCVKDGRGEFVGTIQEITNFMVDRGVQAEEVQFAVEELISKEHDIADFNVGFSGTGPMFVMSQKAPSNADQG